MTTDAYPNKVIDASDSYMEEDYENNENKHVIAPDLFICQPSVGAGTQDRGAEYKRQ